MLQGRTEKHRTTALHKDVVHINNLSVAWKGPELFCLLRYFEKHGAENSPPCGVLFFFVDFLSLIPVSFGLALLYFS